MRAETMLIALLLATAVTTARAGLIDAIGRDVGLTRSQEVDEAHGARMLQDANDGRPDNLYFAALLHLYGKGGVSESPNPVKNPGPLVKANMPSNFT